MYTVRIFIKCTHICGSKSLLTLYQIKIKPDFPSLADEIVEQRPNMNIKVAAFTVSEKSIDTRVKSGNLGHQVNSDTHLQTVEILKRWLLMSRLIRIFTVCLVNLFQ